MILALCKFVCCKARKFNKLIKCNLDIAIKKTTMNFLVYMLFKYKTIWKTKG